MSLILLLVESVSRARSLQRMKICARPCREPASSRLLRLERDPSVAAARDEELCTPRGQPAPQPCCRYVSKDLAFAFPPRNQARTSSSFSNMIFSALACSCNSFTYSSATASLFTFTANLTRQTGQRAMYPLAVSSISKNSARTLFAALHFMVSWLARFFHQRKPKSRTVCYFSPWSKHELHRL